jgi:Sulfotransferase domain
VTLVNHWRQRESGDHAQERQAWVECDGCLPPRGMVGAVPHLRATGWSFDDIHTGPHLCPWCSARPRHRGRRSAAPPQQRPALPNLLIIGAAKSGTTSLHHYLSLHPEIFMSEIKELKFFHDPRCLDRLDLYATFFTRDAPVRGESTTTYTWHPLAPAVPERIRASIPQVKMIYLVRDPVERAISMYVEARAGGRETRPFEEALWDAGDPYNRYVATGKYATQLEQYTKLFPLEQLLIIDQADLLTRRGETLQRVFRFLEVDDSFISPGFDELSNVRETKRRWRRLGLSLKRSRLADAVRLAPPGARRVLFGPARRVARARTKTPPVDSKMRHRLRAEFKDEVEGLRALTGQAFASWQL